MADESRLLDSLRDAEPLPTGRVDVGRAMRAGRRGVRARRTLAAVSAACAVAAIAVLPSLTRSFGDRPQPAVTPSGFDVMVKAVTVGSAGGFTPDSYETGQDEQRVHLRAADPARAGLADAVVEVYPRGHAPFTGRPAPQVYGRAAYWLAAPVLRQGARELAWQWAPGEWGVVSVKGQGLDELTAHRVAQSVQPGSGERVRLPFTLRGWPAGQPVGTLTTYPGVRSKAAIRFRGVEVGVEGGVRPAVQTATKVTLPGKDVTVYAEGSLGTARLRELAADVIADG